MAKLTVTRDAYHRKGYTRKDGTRVAPADVPATTYRVRDRGKPGRTPMGDQWYNPKVHTGWSKDLSQKVRVAKVVKAHRGNLLRSARAMQALANVTTDPATKRAAQADARLLYRKYGGK